jgi:hypothetical protein
LHFTIENYVPSKEEAWLKKIQHYWLVIHGASTGNIRPGMILTLKREAHVGLLDYVAEPPAQLGLIPPCHPPFACTFVDCLVDVLTGVQLFRTHCIFHLAALSSAYAR